VGVAYPGAITRFLGAVSVDIGLAWGFVYRSRRGW